MPVGRDWVCWCLLAVAVGCLGVALFPQWDEWVDPATGDRVSEQRLGLWFSPVHQSVRREPPQGGFRWQAGVNWISWSSLLLAVGVCCFEAFRQRRCGSSGGNSTARDMNRSSEGSAEPGAAADGGGT